MSEYEYLSAQELAALVGCKPNRRTAMVSWLEANHWRFAVDRNGLPKVARAYHDRKLGVTTESKQSKYADEPNLQAFA